MAIGPRGVSIHDALLTVGATPLDLPQGRQLAVASPLTLTDNGPKGTLVLGVGNVSDLVASAVATELTTTAPTTIANYTAPTTGNYAIETYVQVTAETPVTLYVQWTDSTGSQQQNILNAINIAAGRCSFMPLPITAQAGTAITVWAQAGTAHAVYVSATITKE